MTSPPYDMTQQPKFNKLPLNERISSDIWIDDFRRVRRGKYTSPNEESPLQNNWVNPAPSRVTTPSRDRPATSGPMRALRRKKLVHQEEESCEEPEKVPEEIFFATAINSLFSSSIISSESSELSSGSHLRTIVYS